MHSKRRKFNDYNDLFRIANMRTTCEAQWKDLVKSNKLAVEMQFRVT